MNLQYEPFLKELALVISVGLLLMLYYRLFDKGYLGAQALRTFNRQFRMRWVNAILRQSGTELLAAQVLRNSIMSATVMASTCVLLVIAIMSLVSDTDKFASHWLDVVTLQGLWRVKVASLLLFVFISFWHFSQAIRFYGHTSYLLGMPKQADEDTTLQEQQAISLLNTAGHLFSSGNRYFFYSLALALWWFGIIYYCVGVVILMLMNWVSDRHALKMNAEFIN